MTTMKSPDLARYYWLSAIQLLVLILVTVAIAVFKPYGWFECIVGGLNALVPYAWFSFRVLSKGQVRKSAQMVVMANRGAIEKYVLTAVGFACIFVILKPENTLFIFVGFIAVVAAQMLGTVLMSWPKSIN